MHSRFLPQGVHVHPIQHAATSRAGATHSTRLDSITKDQVRKQTTCHLPSFLRADFWQQSLPSNIRCKNGSLSSKGLLHTHPMLLFLPTLKVTISSNNVNISTKPAMPGVRQYECLHWKRGLARRGRDTTREAGRRRQKIRATQVTKTNHLLSVEGSHGSICFFDKQCRRNTEYGILMFKRRNSEHKHRSAYRPKRETCRSGGLKVVRIRARARQICGHTGCRPSRYVRFGHEREPGTLASTNLIMIPSLNNW